MKTFSYRVTFIKTKDFFAKIQHVEVVPLVREGSKA